jgi:hypothetical protein
MASQVGRTEVDDAPTATRRPGRARGNSSAGTVDDVRESNLGLHSSAGRVAKRRTSCCAGDGREDSEECGRSAGAGAVRGHSKGGIRHRPPPSASHAAAQQNSRYRWLRAPAIIILCTRSSSLGDLSSPQRPRGSSDGTVLFACAALSIAARLPCSWILSSHLRSEDDGVDRPTEDFSGAGCPYQKAGIRGFIEVPTPWHSLPSVMPIVASVLLSLRVLLPAVPI